MLWPGLSSTFNDQIALWFYEENVTHLAMPGIAKAHLTWNSVKESNNTDTITMRSIRGIEDFHSP